MVKGLVENVMLPKGKILTAVGTLLAAFAIGYVMQGGAVAARIDPTDESLGQTPSLASGVPLPPAALVVEAPALIKESPLLRVAALEQNHLSPAVISDALQASDDSMCPVSLKAVSMADAMVGLTLAAPCAADQTVTFTHAGLQFSALLDASGDLFLAVPALEKSARFEATLASGAQVETSLDVFTIDTYSRVVLQWIGEAHLELHAFENGAEFGAVGHIWSEAPSEPTRARTSHSGYMIELGSEIASQAAHSQIYSFPVDWAKTETHVALVVEAEVTQATCGRQIGGKIFEIAPFAPTKGQSFFVDMPDCHAIGDFIQLKNIIPELKIASN